MKTSKEELSIRAKLAVEDCEKFLNEHTQADGTLSAEDKAVYDEMLKKAKGYKDAIDLQNGLEGLKNEMGQPTTKPIVTTPEKTDAKVEIGRAHV